MKRLYLTLTLILALSCSKDSTGPDNSIVNYFPIENGSKWQYNAHYQAQLTGQVISYSGIESWEILEFSNTSKTGKLKCAFAGNKYDMEWRETEFDTVAVESVDCGKDYNFKLNNGKFSYQRSSSTLECKTVFDYFVNIFADYPITVAFSPDSAEIVSIDTRIMEGKILLKYKLQRNVGIIEFLGGSDHIWGGESVSYKLIKE